MAEKEFLMVGEGISTVFWWLSWSKLRDKPVWRETEEEKGLWRKRVLGSIEEDR